MSDPRSRRSSRVNVQRINNSLNNQMAYSRRSSSFSYRRYGRRYSSYGRSSVSRSRKQFAAARSQRDAARQVLKWQSTQSITISAGSQEGVTSFNAWQALKNSGFYNLFAQMYDQIKLNAVHVKITLLSANAGIYSATNNPVFCSAWDRNGTAYNPNSVITYQSIASYGSAMTKPLTVGANFGTTRSLYASTMAEKSQYLPTADLPTSNYDDETSTYQYAFPIPFRPILLMGVFSNTKDQTNSNTLSFSVEWSFDVTFRGTRNDPNAIETTSTGTQ